MENKYYTPDIEDLRIGYFCQNRLTGKDWLDLEITKKDALFISSFVKDLEIGNLQTKYLDKEDIESKQWKFHSLTGDGIHESHLIYVKNSYMLVISQYPQVEELTRNIQIYNDKKFESCIFKGECKSINELNTISKLINIK